MGRRTAGDILGQVAGEEQETLLDHVRAQLASAGDGGAAYREVFSTPTGRQVLRQLVWQFNVLMPIADMGQHEATDPFTLGMREGARTVVLHIIEQLHMTPDAVFELFREADNAGRTRADNPFG